MNLFGPILVVLLVAGLLVGYVLLRREMERKIAELKKWVEESHTAASASLPDLAPVLPGPAAKPAPAKVVEAPVAKNVAAPPKAAPQAASPKKEELTPEILAVIAAAVAQFLGAGARVRSARALPIPESNAWAQQGRVFIQASHNLGMR